MEEQREPVEPITEKEQPKPKAQREGPRRRIDDYQLYRSSHLPSEGRVEAFLQCLEEMSKHEIYRFPLRLFLEGCAKCNTCASQCHLTADGNTNESWLPAKRSDLLRRVYKRRHTLTGRILGRLVGAQDLSEDLIDEMYESFYRCTMCRRCSLECPLGLDNSLITRVGRACLSRAGMVPNNFRVSIEAQLNGPARNTSAIPEAAFLDTIEFLNEEMEELTGRPIKFPVNQKGAEILFVAPVSDYIMEADTLMGIAMVFYAAGESWTIATGPGSDSINYGLFYDDRWLEQNIKNLHEVAKELKVKQLVIGECGHATKAQKVFAPYFLRDLPARGIRNVLEVTANYIKEGRIRLDPSRNTRSVTLHDPCNLSRMGGLTETMRYVLRAAVQNFVEMEPHGEENYCCGGGGGLVGFEEIYDFRMEASGRKKVEQLKETGAEQVAAPCANCKKQLRELIDYHKLEMEVVGIHDLVAKALVWSD